MADCAMSCALRTSNCYQEKTRVRKELNRWTKNLLLLVGLERVAQELMGGKRWSKLMAPSLDHLEPSEPQDWFPQEACCFCISDKKDTIEAVFHTDECAITISKIAGTSESTQCNCSGFSKTSTGANGLDGGSVTTTTGLAEQPLDLSLHSRCKSDTSDGLVSETTPLLRVPQPTTTAKSSKKTRPESSTNWKRTYTEKELQAALNDIQSGKLGTRRAAVIYGIPRSTLRNKVYKLCSDRKKGSSASTVPPSSTANVSNAKKGSNATKSNVGCNGGNQNPCGSSISNGSTSPNSACHSKDVENNNINIFDIKEGEWIAKKSKTDEPNNTADHLTPNMIHNSNTNNSVAREALMQVLKRAINQRGSSRSFDQSDTDSVTSNLNNSTGSLKKAAESLSNLTAKNSANILSDPLSTLQMLNSLDRGNSLGPLLYQILLNVHSFPWLTPSSADNSVNNSELNKSISNTLPFLHELIPKLVQERVKAERTHNDNNFKSNSGDTNMSDGYFCDTSNNVILRVPSYQPKSSLESSNISQQPPTPLSTTSKNSNSLTTSSLSSLSSLPSYPAFDERKESCNLNDQTNISNDSTFSSHSPGDRKDNSTKDESHIGSSDDRSLSRLGAMNSDESSSDALMNENKNSPSQRQRKGEKRHPPLSIASDQSAPSTPDPKRNRPKRGRYRNYKRDDLARAVRAVQMGEMSVHRAGTHFGVPHSTLEYKVKERHLLRPKKRQTSNTSSSSVSIIKRDDVNRSLLVPSKNTLTESTSKSSGTLNQSSPPPSNFSLWQSALMSLDTGSSQNSTNFFASNMMRKLKEISKSELGKKTHQEINNNNNNNINPSNGITSGVNYLPGENYIGPRNLESSRDREFGSFLLETLIKSSLEKKNHTTCRDSDDNDKDGGKFNASLAALKEVTSLDAQKD